MIPGLLAGCSDDPVPRPFPQGIASGDPRPDGVLLWTRVAPSSPGARESVRYVVATDPSFTSIVTQGTVLALPESDHTVRVRLSGLAPRTTYYYRFRVRELDSVVGRTKTAPAPDDDVPVRIAVASCQDFVGRYYHAWRWLAENGGDIDFVLFLGDYIYEYATGTDTSFSEVPKDRSLTLPDGLTVTLSGKETVAAKTLADYRELYRRYKTDPDLQRVHALFPFAIMWDDHEFANDCWQDHATDFNDIQGDEKEPERRHAGTRAWFEYLPVDVPFDDAAPPPADTKTYRAVRWGKHVEIALTDGRAYRSDHVIPEASVDKPVGKILPYSPLGARLLAVKTAFDERERAANPTMLGDEQRRWLTETLQQSNATWKVLASGTVMSPMVLDLRGFEAVPQELRDIVYFKLDQWDGYRSERARLFGDLKGLRNFVVLSGDIHAFYGAHLYEDFDAPTNVPIGVELTAAGITSASVAEQVRTLIEASPILASLGLSKLVDEFDPNMKTVSPHFVYANSKTQGIMVVEFDGDREMRARTVEFDDVKAAAYPAPSRVESFRVVSGSPALLRG